MPNEPYSRRQRGTASTNLLTLTIAVAAVAAGYWFFAVDRQPQQPTPIVMPPLQPTTTSQPTPDPIAAAPDIPELVLDEVHDAPESAPAPLPALADSDSHVRDMLSLLSDSAEFAQWLQTDNLVQKAVAIIDGLARGNVARKLLPLQAPEQPFAVTREDDRIYLDEKNYQRFDSLIQLLTSIPADALARTFHSLRPLLEQAYSDLGNPADRLDNSVIAAIDTMLSTPDVAQPVELIQQSVAYQFADPALESLPAVQKQIIRLGPTNRATLFTYLEELRRALLQSSPTGD